MKKLLSLLLGFLLYFAVIILFTGYGNVRVHRDFNEHMVNSFLSHALNSTDYLQKFNHYQFWLNDDKLSGTGVTKSGDFHPKDAVAGGYDYYEEGTMSKTPKEWIIHGGYSADIPVIPAGLRHFYNATWPPVQRYLCNTANGKIASFGQGLFANPNINGVDWALGEAGAGTGVEEHYYCWENGKMWMKAAFEEAIESKRNDYMAKAWRSLGETLHMIADQGCPSHVRNDSHPPSTKFLWLFEIGDPDVYEETLSSMAKNKPDTYGNVFNGISNKSLVANLSSKTTVRELAHDLAIFTSNNFFSGETITGTEKNGKKIIPLTNKDYPYDLPLLDNMDKEGFYYTAQIGDVTVKQCCVKSMFSSFTSYTAYPYFDDACVISQAKALFPNIIEAGALTIKLFIPEFKIMFESSGNNSYQGTITHITDDEYHEEIRYNGPVTITIKSSLAQKDFEVQAEDGSFEIEDLELEEDRTLVASINCAGIKIESEEINASVEEEDPNKYSFYIDPDPVIWETKTELTLTAKANKKIALSYYYEWDFGDGSSVVTVNNDSIVHYTYAEANDYFIQAKLYVDNELQDEQTVNAYISENSQPDVDPSVSTQVYVRLSCNFYYENNHSESHWGYTEIGASNYRDQYNEEFPVNWGGKTFSTTFDFSPEKEYKGTIRGSLSGDGRTIESLSVSRTHWDRFGIDTYYTFKLEARNIPFDYISEGDSYDTYEYEVTRKDLENSITHLEYTRTYYDQLYGDSVRTSFTDFNGDLMDGVWIPYLSVTFIDNH